jgi:hypothetical protein
VNGMPGPGVGFMQMESQDDRQSGRHVPGRLQSPVPPRSQGLVAHHMGVPTYVSNYPQPKVQVMPTSALPCCPPCTPSHRCRVLHCCCNLGLLDGTCIVDGRLCLAGDLFCVDPLC